MNFKNINKRLEKENKHNTSKNIISQKCIFCNQKVNTSNEIPICSRKSCKKLRYESRGY